MLRSTMEEPAWQALYEAARTGQLPTIRIGKWILVPKSALDQLLNGAVDDLTPPDHSPSLALAGQK